MHTHTCTTSLREVIELSKNILSLIGDTFTETKIFSHLCSQHILVSEQHGFLCYTSSKCIIRAAQWMKQEEKIVCNDIIWGCPACSPCLVHSPLRHMSHIAQGVLNYMTAGNTQSDKLLKPVLISDPTKSQLYSHHISLIGHFVFLMSRFRACLTHTVSSNSSSSLSSSASQ